MSSFPGGATARRRILLILWAAMTLSVVVYCVLATILSESPERERVQPPPALTEALAYLPYVVPLLLFALGWTIYSRIALKGAENGRWGESGQAASWNNLQGGFIAMLAVFEMNVVLGLVFFFLGASLSAFFLFAAGTLILNIIGLRRLISTWPRE